MKKFFAMILCCIASLCMTACLSRDFSADKAAIGARSDQYNMGVVDNMQSFGETDASLDIGIMAIPVTSQDEETTSYDYEIQIGFKGQSDMPLEPEQINAFTDALNAGLGVQLIYDSNYRSSQKHYVYCFDVSSAHYELENTDNNFGFFYITRSYTLKNAPFIDEVEQAAIDAYGVIANSTVLSLSEEKAHTAFKLCIDNGFKSEGATREYVEIPKLMGIYECLVWDELLPSYALDYRAMASGWYIIAIIAGLLAVLILYIIGKKQKDSKNVFKKIEKEERKSFDVLDGQISMDDIEEYHGEE